MTSAYPKPKRTGGQDGLYSSLIFLSLLLTLLTVVLSAYIRLAQSGLDCTPWPDCYGAIGLEAEQQGIAVLTKEGAEMSHKGARVAHRFIASSLGITVMLILLISIRRRVRGQPGLMAASLLMGATLFLAVLGYSTPARTIPWITLGNLGGGMLMLALLWWLGQAQVINNLQIKTRLSKRWAIGALTLIILQIFSGAWVSATFSATACNGELFCNGFSLLNMNWGESFSLARELSLNSQGSILLPDQLATTINMGHRLLAIASLVIIGLFATQMLQEGKPLATTGKALLFFLTVELLLGVISVYYQLPLFLVTAHNLFAALILLCLVNATVYIYRQPA